MSTEKLNKAGDIIDNIDKLVSELKNIMKSLNIEYIPSRDQLEVIREGRIVSQIGRAGGFKILGQIMGYPVKSEMQRYTKWDDHTIKKKIMLAKETLKLDRMPSRKEILTLEDGTGLTAAISKSTKGYYGYAKELNLEIKDSETTVGKNYEYLAGDKLRNMGYDVQQMSQNFPYDILVNNTLKIDVKFSYLYCGKTGNFYSYNLEKPFCTCDIYILIAKESFDIGEIVYRIIPSKFVFNNTQISIGENSSKYNIYINRWDYIDQYIEFYKNVI